MPGKDDGSNKTTRDGGKPPQEETKATHPANPRQATKPDTKTNDPSAQGPPRGSGHRG
jgi:hypothetical protein